MAQASVNLTERPTIDLTDDGRLAPPPQSSTLPLGRRGQLETLRLQLEWCTHAVRVAQRQADTAMRSSELDTQQRWEAVRRLRNLAWKVCREVLPLTGRVPPALQAHPEFTEVMRATHELRRQTEDALRDNANYTVDLVSALEEPFRGRGGG